MNLEPEVERQIERVLILADEPILKRPFSVELVKLALPQACQVDRPLCTRVQKYLERYSHDYGVTHASAAGSITHSKDGVVLPNQHGMPVDSDYELSAIGYVQPTDYFLVSAGGIAYKGRTEPTGSMASLGTNWAQLDLGYRDHWFSPMTDSSSLISTEAPTTPSVTLSNYEPLTRLGFQYELFLTRLSSQQIIFNGNQAIGKLTSAGDYIQLGSSVLPAGWTHIVTGTNNIVFFYNSTTGDAQTGKLDDSGNFTPLKTQMPFGCDLNASPLRINAR